MPHEEKKTHPEALTRDDFKGVAGPATVSGVSVAVDMVVLSMMDVTIVTNPRMKAALVLR